MFTKSEKDKIIKNFKAEHVKKIRSFRQDLNKKADLSEKKVLRRLNSVSVTLWNVNLRDALEVERHHQVTIKTLLRDIQAYKQQELDRKFSKAKKSVKVN